MTNKQRMKAALELLIFALFIYYSLAIEWSWWNLFWAIVANGVVEIIFG